MNQILSCLLISSLLSACGIENHLSSKEKQMVDVISNAEKSQPVKVFKRKDGMVEVEYLNTKYVIKSGFVMEVFERDVNDSCGWLLIDVKNEH
jgi:hypothetical protein